MLQPVNIDRKPSKELEVMPRLVEDGSEHAACEVIAPALRTLLRGRRCRRRRPTSSY